MTAPIRLSEASRFAPAVFTGLTFLALFWEPIGTLVRDWVYDPESAHGLLMFPIAVYLAWRGGLVPERSPQQTVGLLLLSAAVLLRIVSALAGELLTMRLSLIVAMLGMVVWYWGWCQVRHWWLSFALLLLSVPIPAVLLNSMALPLQFKASQFGAALLRMRHVPILVAGNVIHLPNRALFVTEACSGLRSLTALIALGVLGGGLWLQTGWARVALLVIAVPVAVVINAIRVFLTGYLVFYVTPTAAEGFLHYSEGWAMFLVALGMLGLVTWTLARAELWAARTN